MKTAKMTFALGLMLCLLVSADAIPARCCLEYKWEAYMGTTEATLSPQYNGVKKGTKHISMDFLNQRMSILSQYSPGVPPPTRTITDFPNNVEYRIQGGTCTRSTLSFGMQPRCIPANADYLGSSHMGGGESNQIPFDSWKYYLAGYQVNVSLSVSTTGCVPLAEIVESSSSTHEHTMMAVFTTFTLGIQDTSVFTPPPNCPT